MATSPADRVLVIDDSPLALSIARGALEGGGFNVRTVADGASGLAELVSHAPDLVLCDLQMPTMDGFQVLFEVQRYTPATPVLIFTDASEVDKAVEAMKRGAASYILKGASDQELVDEVRTALAQRRDAECRRAQVAQLATMGTLAAGVAHEINSPLSYVTANVSFVRGALEGALVEPVDRESCTEAIQALREAEQGIARINQIVRDIKALSRRDDQKLPVNLREILESSARMVAPTVRKHARLVVDIPRSLPAVLGDACRLSQVVINLLVNAAQAIPEGRVQENEVRLSAREEHGSAILEVHDSGAGMTAEVKARLFEPFFTTKPAGVGTGLGLSICQCIVTAHGGSLTAESEVGRGTTFRIQLPASAGRA